MEHTFLLVEALWRTEGEFFDGTGNRAEVEVEGHYPDKWIYRLTQVSDSLGGTITRSYDDLDRVTQEVTAQGTVSYSNDVVRRRTSYGYERRQGTLRSR